MTQELSPAPRTLPHLCLHPEVESSTHSLRFSPLFIVQPRSRMMDDVTSPLKSALLPNAFWIELPNFAPWP